MERHHKTYNDGGYKNGFMLDDREMNLYGSLCTFCKHNPERVFVCMAFPKGIPEKYYSGTKHHTSVCKEQSNNIVFQPANEMSADYVKRFILK